MFHRFCIDFFLKCMYVTLSRSLKSSSSLVPSAPPTFSLTICEHRVIPAMKPTEVRAFPGLSCMCSWEKINDSVLCINKKCTDNIVNILMNCSPLTHLQKEVNCRKKILELIGDERFAQQKNLLSNKLESDIHNHTVLFSLGLVNTNLKFQDMPMFSVSGGTSSSLREGEKNWTFLCAESLCSIRFYTEDFPFFPSGQHIHCSFLQ